MADKKDIFRETDDEARLLAKNLVRQARYAAIATIEPETGDPMASRVLTGTDVDGTPVILISALAPHMAALVADPRASLLYGEVGKGDPLAHARLTLTVISERVERGSGLDERIRRRFIARHPKANIYADFPDFAFFRLNPVSANLNGGFGRAYLLPGDDFLIASPALEALAEIETSTIDYINANPTISLGNNLKILAASKEDGWMVVGFDAAGLDFSNGNQILRVDFPRVINEASETIQLVREFLR